MSTQMLARTRISSSVHVCSQIIVGWRPGPVVGRVLREVVRALRHDDGSGTDLVNWQPMMLDARLAQTIDFKSQTAGLLRSCPSGLYTSVGR